MLEQESSARAVRDIKGERCVFTELKPVVKLVEHNRSRRGAIGSAIRRKQRVAPTLIINSPTFLVRVLPAHQAPNQCRVAIRSDDVQPRLQSLSMVTPQNA